eukprot:COSAG06_NODE_48217_length_333_cov_1.816239_1_plen_45_part_10
MRATIFGGYDKRDSAELHAETQQVGSRKAHPHHAPYRSLNSVRAR